MKIKAYNMSSHAPIGDIHDREAVFHDKCAIETPVEQLLVCETFEAVTAQENRFIMKLISRRMGGLRGKTVLDAGSGFGESAVYFAIQGAEVTAMDISEHMVDRCLDLAKYYNVEGRVKGVVGSAELFALPDTTFDIIYAANVFHHVANLESALINLNKHLRPGGMLISWDPIAYNPVINQYRDMAVNVRTEDEHPLRYCDLKTIRRIFPNASCKGFWLSSLALFLKYYIIDRKDPNEHRYWKEILMESEGPVGWWFSPLIALDSVLLKVPGAKWLAWNMVVWATKDDIDES